MFSLFSVQFLGALNDNLFKNALVVWFTFTLATSESDGGLLVTLAAGLFILPFAVFSAYAGQLADTHDKVRLIRKIKLAEIGIMGLGALALLSESVELMLISLFFMGAQSAFFGPIKYSILPELYSGAQLVKVNGLFSGSTFIAILLGTIFGGLGIMLPTGEMVMAVLVVLVSVLGYVASLRFTADLPIASHPEKQSFWSLIQQARAVPVAFKAVLAISWFWFFGAVILSQIPTLVKFQIHGDDSVVVVLLTLFSVGIAIGSALIAKWMKHGVHLRWHPAFLLGMAASLVISIWLISEVEQRLPAGEVVLSALQLFMLWPLNLLLISFALMAIFGGAFIVPLYTLVQTATPDSQRARMIAVNNIINSLLMVVSALLIMLGYAFGLELLTMLWILVAMTIIVAMFFIRSMRKTCHFEG